MSRFPRSAHEKLRRLGSRLLATAFILAACHAAPAFAARVVVFGDSWGVPAPPRAPLSPTASFPD
jgi:hypothetical protein